MDSLEKWPNIFYKSCGVKTARFLKCVWLFFNIMHERFEFATYRFCIIFKALLFPF